MVAGPLHTFCQRGHLSAGRELTREGLDFPRKHPGWSLQLWGVAEESVRLVRILHFVKEEGCRRWEIPTAAQRTGGKGSKGESGSGIVASVSL